MTQTTDLLDAARSIRPYLSELVGEAKATTIDQKLASLLEHNTLEHNNERSTKLKIIKLLNAERATSEWMEGFLQDKTAT